MYIIITAARNEGEYIENLIQSVVSQTILPFKWIIVSDGSKDNTEDIVTRYINQYDFINYIKINGDKERNFGSKIKAFNEGVNKIESIFNNSDYFIGNIDADITFEKDYFEILIQKFKINNNLGIGGGWIYEKYKEEFVPRKLNSPKSVPHAVQFIRNKCFKDIGGYIPLKYGGEDWYAEVKARMHSWEVQSFPEIVVHHHRKTASAMGILKGSFIQGYRAYYVGSHPVYEIIKNIQRVNTNPLFIGSILRLLGFFWCYTKKDKLLVSDSFIKYLRSEQKYRVKHLLFKYFGN